ncbi:MAG: ATPase [Clostridia bacterium]|nr:ATPase [Clostridia bacterium]
MDIMEIINLMEENVEKAPTVPLSGKILLDKEDILDYIQEMRLSYPDEVKEAKWVKEERQRILSEAEARADSMIKTAEAKMIQMVDENEITKQAQEYATKLVEDAKAQSSKLITDSDQYADDILGDVERRLEMLLKKVTDDRNYFNNK